MSSENDILSLDAINKMALSYHQAGDLENALIYYSKSLNIEPSSAHIHYNLGLLFIAKKNVVAAILQFQNVLKLTPNHAPSLEKLGSLHIENKDIKNAKIYLNKSIDLDSANSDIYNNLGVIALQEDQTQLAIEYFSKALALDNDNLKAQNNLAATFLQYDRFDNAIVHYSELLKAEPENHEYIYNIAVAYMHLGKLEDAKYYFNKTIKTNNYNIDSLLNLAAIAKGENNTVLAISYYKQVLKLSPENEIARFILASLTGTTPAQTPVVQVKSLFDNYAHIYEKHMTETLQYQAPQLIADILPNILENDILDLGCGTGIIGEKLEGFNSLTGVDLSAKMLAIASKKSHYTDLIENDILSYLDNSKHKYDLIIAAEVLSYFGELSQLFTLIKKSLNKKGVFIFTVEISKNKNFFLQQSARFAHSLPHLEELLDGFTIEYKQEITSRKHEEGYLKLLLVKACLKN